MSVFRLRRPEYEEIVATVEAVNSDLGPGEVTLRFRYLDGPERESLVTSLGDQSRDGKRRSDLDIARDLLLGWEGVEYEDRGPMEYSDKALVLMYSHPHVARAITEAIKDFLFGVAVRRKKNSPARAGNGRPAMDG